jgi:hypothetical protein
LEYLSPPLEDDDQEIIHRVREYLADRGETAQDPPPAAGEYDPATLSVLFGGAIS